MSYRNIDRDPRRMPARFTSTCAKCGKTVKKGEEIVYFPITRKAGHFLCYEEDWNSFQSTLIDEQLYQQQYPGER